MTPATRIVPDPLTADVRACTRCGLVREVKASSGDKCRDCRTMPTTRPPLDNAGSHGHFALQRAQALACMVRDEGRDAIGDFLDRLDRQALYGLCVALAAMAPVDVPARDLIAWIDSGDVAA